MNKKDLKQLIKPLVKECIHEVLIEEGLLSNVVAEVAKGMQGNLIVGNKRERKNPSPQREGSEIKKKPGNPKRRIEEHRRKMADAIGTDAYNGVNLFEGTTPLSSGGDPASGPKMNSVLGADSNDPGVDISSLVGDASKIWKAIK